MARDENDRPFDDGQARSLNPEMTGDVLSPRWSTDDTDEQPAIQVVGNETYILPPDKGTPLLIGDGGPRDVLDDDPVTSHDLLSGHGGAHDLAGGQHDVLGSPSQEVLGDPGAPDDVLSGTRDVAAEHRVEEEPPYLPLDRSYETTYDDRDEEQPKRGFLGSGWTGDSGDGHSGGSRSGDREVRRRTRMLLVAAAAVVLVGVGAGFLLTGTSSDDPCTGGQCASAGEVTAPTESAVPEDTPAEDDTTAEPTDSATAEPTETEPANPNPTAARARPTREPSARPTRTRIGEPTAKSSNRPTRQPEPQIRDTDGPDSRPSSKTATDEPSQQSSQPATQAPATSQAPAPTPTRQEREGLLDILFPW